MKVYKPSVDKEIYSVVKYVLGEKLSIDNILHLSSDNVREL